MLWWYGYSGVTYCFAFFEYNFCARTEGYYNLLANFELSKIDPNKAKHNFCTVIFESIYLSQTTNKGLVNLIFA